MTRKRRDIQMTGRGFTLIELLTVIVLLSLAAGLGAGYLSTATDSANQRAVLASVLDLDARARLLARRSGPVRLVLMEKPDAQTVVLVREEEAAHQAGWLNEGDPIARITIPRPIRLELRDERGRVLEAVSIDGRGQSANYQIALRGPAGEAEHRVLGLTGQVMEEAAP